MERPRLFANYYVRLEPGAPGGEDLLVFTSGRREIRLAGRSFTDFLTAVVPLLDGRHTIEEIRRSCGFAEDELRRALELLADQGLLEDAALDILDDETRARFGPQLHWLHEAGLPAQQTQQKLRDSIVAVVGSGCLSGHAAASLEAGGLGTIRRVAAVHADIRAAVAGAHFVIAAVDAGLSSVLYQLNRACLDLGIPWTSAAAAAHEGLLGPTVIPGRTPCYLCFKMRAVACASDPAAAFRFEQFLDEHKLDDSSRRENLPFIEGVLGQLLGLEAVKVLAGVDASAEGTLLAINFLTLETSRHVVLRKPGCPLCGR